MFAPHTVEAIVALAAVDGGVTETERQNLRTLLAGRRSFGRVTYKEAARRLNFSVPTVKKMAREGTLERVYTTGNSTRACGVSEESVINYATGKEKKQ